MEKINFAKINFAKIKADFSLNKKQNNFPIMVENFLPILITELKARIDCIKIDILKTDTILVNNYNFILNIDDEQFNSNLVLDADESGDILVLVITDIDTAISNSFL